jgi:biopolymer transport protein ExbD
MIARRGRRRGRPGTPGEADPGFQIAPMIDVVFVVLVFFMALAAQIRVERDLALRLPGAAGPGAAPLPEEEYTVAVGPLGEISFNDEPCDGPESADLPRLRTLLEALRAGRAGDRSAGERASAGTVAAAGAGAAAGASAAVGASAVAGMRLEREEGPAVVIASDPASRYERTIAVMDALAAAGIRRVSLAGEEDPP